MRTFTVTEKFTKITEVTVNGNISKEKFEEQIKKDEMWTIRARSKKTICNHYKRTVTEERANLRRIPQSATLGVGQ